MSAAEPLPARIETYRRLFELTGAGCSRRSGSKELKEPA
jgi:hypothetical protein